MLSVACILVMNIFLETLVTRHAHQSYQTRVCICQHGMSMEGRSE